MPCIATGDSIISVQGSDSAIGLIFMYLRTAGTFSASWFCFRYVQSKDVVDAGLSGGRERREKEKGIKGECGGHNYKSTEYSVQQLPPTV